MEHQIPAPIRNWIDCLSDRRWPVVFQHGDLASWNISPILREIFPPSIGNMALAGHGFSRHRLLCPSDCRIDPAIAGGSAELRHRLPDPQPLAGPKRHDAEAITALAAYDAWSKALADGDSPNEPLQQWQRSIWDCRQGQDCPAPSVASVPPARVGRPRRPRRAGVIIASFQIPTLK